MIAARNRPKARRGDLPAQRRYAAKAAEIARQAIERLEDGARCGYQPPIINPAIARELHADSGLGRDVDNMPPTIDRPRAGGG